MAICKAIVIARNKTSLYLDTFDRRCKKKAVTNGLCAIHHRQKTICGCGNKIKHEEWGVCDECK